jgi:hypothetical protein
MKRTITLTLCLLAGVLCFPASASAGRSHWGFGVGFGSHGTHFGFRYEHGRRHRGHRHRHFRPHRHVHRHVPVYRPRLHRHRIWVPPVYSSVFVGYDLCGNPLYSRVVVSPGYYAWR